MLAFASLVGCLNQDRPRKGQDMFSTRSLIVFVSPVREGATKRPNWVVARSPQCPMVRAMDHNYCCAEKK